MKYSVLVVSLLLSAVGLAAEPDVDSVLIKKLSTPACKAFCDMYQQDVATCNMSTDAAGTMNLNNTEGTPASISGTTAAITYEIQCKYFK